MFWRGVTSTSPDREVLLDVTKDHPDVADIVEMVWGDPSGPAPSAYVSPLEMCAWKYIIYTEGILLYNRSDKQQERRTAADLNTICSVIQ